MDDYVKNNINNNKLAIVLAGAAKHMQYSTTTHHREGQNVHAFRIHTFSRKHTRLLLLLKKKTKRKK